MYASKLSASSSSVSHTDRVPPGPSPLKQEKQAESLLNASVIKQLEKTKSMSPHLVSYPKKDLDSKHLTDSLKQNGTKEGPRCVCMFSMPSLCINM